MIDRLIITAKNRDFPRIGDRLSAVQGCFPAAGKRSPAVDAIQLGLPPYSDTQSASGSSAELMNAKPTPTTQPEEAPASSGTSCRSCGGCGWNYNDYICPLSRNWTKERVACGLCHGTGYDVVAA